MSLDIGLAKSPEEGHFKCSNSVLLQLRSTSDFSDASEPFGFERPATIVGREALSSRLRQFAAVGSDLLGVDVSRHV